MLYPRKSKFSSGSRANRVGQERTEESLLRLNVGRRQTLGEAEERRVDGVHAAIALRR